VVAALLPGVAAADTELVATVVPAVSLVDAAGAPVTHLAPGTYTVVVHDLTSQDNFHLYGPGGVDLFTDIPFVGDVTWTVTLVPGRYYYKPDVRNEFQTYAFDVGTVAAPVAPPAPKPAAVPRPATKKPAAKKPAVKKAAAGSHP
jgi:hypothetical protein